MVERWSFDRYLHLEHTEAHAPSHVRNETRRVWLSTCFDIAIDVWKWMHQDCFRSSQMVALKQARDPLASSLGSKHVDVVTSHTALRTC